MEKLAADIVQDLTTYPTGNKVTLAAGDKFTNTSANPFSIFETAKEAVRGKIAQRPNVCVLGASAYSALKNILQFWIELSTLKMQSSLLNFLSQLLDFDELYVGDAVYADDSGTFNDIWSDNVVIAFVPKAMKDVGRSYYEPAFGYTLRKKNNPVVDTYTEGGKVEIIRNTDLFVSKVVGSDAGYLINDTNAVMKYKVINSDIYLNKKIIPENSEVELTKEQTKGIEDFLVACHSDPALAGEESFSKTEHRQSEESKTKY